MMQLFLRIPRVAEAFEFCVVAHREQRYGARPYYTHPLEVAETVANGPFANHATEDEIIAALLHDVVEDTPFTLQDIADQFGDSVAEIVGLLTKDRSLTYEGNILRIISSGNRAAIKVKWADNMANMSGDKSGMDAERRERLNAKYAKSFSTLSAVLGV